MKKVKQEVRVGNSTLGKITMVGFALVLTLGLSACGGSKSDVGSAAKQGIKNEITKEIVADKINNATDKVASVSNKIKEVSPAVKAKAFKSFKACLVKASDKSAAIACHKEAAKNMYKLGINKDDSIDMEDVEAQVGDWSSIKKENQLKEMDAVIKLMESMSNGFGQ